MQSSREEFPYSPERGCGNSHSPYTRSAHPPEGFCFGRNFL